MTGIVSYGAYVPPTRLGFDVIAGRPAKPGEPRPERAVAWADEDAITMAVAAGANALRGFDRAGVDALLFASTSHPFREKQSAALVAKALGLRRDVATADVAGSLRAGTGALRAACGAVFTGSIYSQKGPHECSEAALRSGVDARLAEAMRNEQAASAALATARRGG